MQKAERAIMFECEKCGRINFEEDTLDYEPHESEKRWIRFDRIDCDKCGHENAVYMELD